MSYTTSETQAIVYYCHTNLPSVCPYGPSSPGYSTINPSYFDTDIFSSVYKTCTEEF